MWLCVSVPQKQPTNPDFVLDAQQRQVVEHELGAVRVIGAAGSGKTEALIASVMARLAESSSESGDFTLPSRRVLVLAYDKPSAVSLRTEFARRVGTGSMPTVTTFHALAWSIISHYGNQDDGQVGGLRLLSGPEQDPRVRELLQWAVRDGTVQLPDEFNHALGTRGLAEEVRRLFAKAQQLGLSPTDLASLGSQNEIKEWEALSSFFGEYLDSTLAEGGIDYSALLPGAARYLEEFHDDDFVFDSIFVDEYQDVEPGQTSLLRALTERRARSELVVFGSPDEMIFGFRGAVSDALTRFNRDFADLSGQPVTTIALENQYRMTPGIETSARHIVGRTPLAGLPVEAQRALREPRDSEPQSATVHGNSGANGAPVDSSQASFDESDPDVPDVPEVEVSSYVTLGAQYASIAESIRRLKLSGGVKSWSDIAVISRTASHGLQQLEQTLVSSGIPVVSMGANVALRDEPGVCDLLILLQIALVPEDLTRERARAVALGPIGQITPSQYRSLSRTLRDIATKEGEEPKSAADAFAKALLDPARCLEVEVSGSRELVALSELIARAIDKAQVESAYEVLWLLWSSTKWPSELYEKATSNSSLSRSANRTLDAVMSLFEVIRHGERVTGTSMSAQMLLDELKFQGFTPGLGSTGSTIDGVQLLSAHSAKGQSWPVVFVIDLQEGSWPRVSHSVSLLQTDRLSEGDPVDPVSAIDQIRDERRLLYVAMSRASERLFVSCVSDDIESSFGSSPSRFFNELVTLAQSRPELGIVDSTNLGVPPRSLTTASLIAQLRHVLENPHASLELKHAAANRLNLLNQAGVRAANPDTWWGMRDWSVSDKAIRDPEQPLRVSGSMWKDVADCSLKWFLDREAGGSSARGVSTAFGSIIHALADSVAKGDVEPDLGELTSYVEFVWHKLGIEAQWQNIQQKEAIVESLERFLNWQDPKPRNRELVATEQNFDAVVQTDIDPDSTKVETQARIVGTADRLELDSEGRTVVVDLKNQSSLPSRAEVADHKQLWLYQLAVMVGAFEGDIAQVLPTESGGAELIQLKTKRVSLVPTEQTQQPASREELLAALREMVETLRTEDFTANPSSSLCQFCDFQAVCPGKSKGAEVVD